MTRIELNTFPRSNSTSSVPPLHKLAAKALPTPYPADSNTPPPVNFCVRGQVLTILVAPGHYALKSIAPRDCFAQPNFLLEVTQEVYNDICMEHESILARHFSDCRSDYTFGYKMDNNKLEGPAFIGINSKTAGVRVRFYNCELTQATLDGIHTTTDYLSEVGGYLMFHIIHWRPKSLLKTGEPLPLHRYKFIDGRFFKDPEEWELFLHQQRQHNDATDEDCANTIELGRIVY